MNYSRIFIAILFAVSVFSSVSIVAMYDGDDGFMPAGYAGSYRSRGVQANATVVGVARRDVTEMMAKARSCLTARGVVYNREQRTCLIALIRDGRSLLDALASHDSVITARARGAFAFLDRVFNAFRVAFRLDDGADDALLSVRFVLTEIDGILIENIKRVFDHQPEALLRVPDVRHALSTIGERFKRGILCCLYGGGAVGCGFLLRNCIRQVAAHVHPCLTGIAILGGILSSAGLIGLGKRAKESFTGIYR